MRPPLIREQDGVLVITLDDAAALNDSQSVGLRQLLFGSLPESGLNGVVGDLGAIDFLSSSGISLLIGLKRKVEERGGRLVFIRARPNVLDQLRIMRLVDFFLFAPNLPAAVELFPPAPSA